ncbi:DNA-directed RNA polymerase subunit beta [Paenibacillus flagellatus]|uniref:DNA-directed RNA polymerase subunit beta n=1 Tax=Paenibacillus flagellatus TaxID=2211139 RepID=A0A2V5JWH1_9BACL|nr:DNA-directed RNA polymerase subunit beta [Paenibacillus flagellatus]PYI51155.1 DNA-directed RNA polymerase subunit beta [Paenibacillus flagellatus]
MNDQDTNVRESPKGKLRPRWAKIVLRVLRALLIPFLCLVALIVGLWIGYSYIGGRSAADVWQWSTWKHLFDLVFAT